MYPNGYDGLTIPVGDVANSYEFMFDINVGTLLEKVWLNIPQITGLNPQQSPKLRDVTTYADQGGTNQKKTGNDFTLDFNLLKVRDATGEFQPEWLALKEAADGTGSDNNLEIRYYDSRGASDAYQGTVSVGRGSRPQTGNDEIGWDNFTFASVGAVLPIPNPLVSAAVALITAVGPTGRGAGGIVTVKGSRFTGTTAITVGGVTVPTTSWTVDDDQTIVLALPAGAAGSAPIIVTKPVGPSAAAPYTRVV